MKLSARNIIKGTGVSITAAAQPQCGDFETS